MPKDMLIHYGVPGMRWGHRKARYDDPEGDRRKRREAKRDNPDEEPHDDYKRTVAKKSLKAMSTKEIQDMNTRIQAENLNRNLTMTRGERAKEWFKKTMIDVGKQSARRFIDHYANMGVDKLTGAIDSRFSSKKKGGSEAEPESAPEIPGLWGKKKKASSDSKTKFTSDEVIEGAAKAIGTAKDITEKAEASNPAVQKAKQDVKKSVSNLRNMKPTSIDWVEMTNKSVFARKKKKNK